MWPVHANNQRNEYNGARLCSTSSQSRQSVSPLFSADVRVISLTLSRTDICARLAAKRQPTVAMFDLVKRHLELTTV